MRNNWFIILALVTIVAALLIFIITQKSGRFTQVTNTPDGRQVDTTPLHFIAVKEGADQSAEAAQPWWAHCQKFKDAKLRECQEQFEKNKLPTVIQVKVAAFNQPIDLALMARRKNQWEISGPGVRSIRKIYLFGREPQTIKGLDKNTRLEVYTSYPSPCDQCFRGEGGEIGHELRQSFFRVLDRVLVLTKRNPSSLQVAEKAATFDIFAELPQFDRDELQRQITHERCLMLDGQINELAKRLDTMSPAQQESLMPAMTRLQQYYQADNCYFFIDQKQDVGAQPK